MAGDRCRRMGRTSLMGDADSPGSTRPVGAADSPDPASSSATTPSAHHSRPPTVPGLLQRANAATLRAVFNPTPTILSITDLETGRFVDVNDAFVRVSGFSRAELIGRPVSEVGVWMDLGQREA